MINKIELLEDLKQIKNRIGFIPSSNEYKKYGKYHLATVARKFGSWNNALIKCFGEVIKERSPKRPIIKCLCCKKNTKNPKFCSSSCAAIYNNIKRKKYEDVNCIKCGKKIRHNCVYCKECLPLYKIEQYGKRTIGEFRKTSASKNRYQRVRNHAHIVANYYNIKKECPYCDYKNHVQLCHIKDIGEFTDITTLNIINGPTNLIYLCPNHHWDLDHGYLKL